jgi:hypothetical protein
MFRIDTFNDKDVNIIFQKVTFLWIFGIGVMHQLNGGEHFGFILEAGPFQMDWTFRYWKRQD